MQKIMCIFVGVFNPLKFELMAKRKSPLTEIRKKLKNANMTTSEIEIFQKLLTDKKEAIKEHEKKALEDKMKALNTEYQELTGATYFDVKEEV